MIVNRCDQHLSKATKATDSSTPRPPVESIKFSSTAEFFTFCLSVRPSGRYRVKTAAASQSNDRALFSVNREQLLAAVQVLSCPFLLHSQLSIGQTLQLSQAVTSELG